MKTNRSAAFILLLHFVVPIGFAQIPVPAHVIIVIEENHDYAQIIGSSAAPYINSLAADSNAALFTQSYGLTHPSQPNYLMLFSGSNQGVTNDNLPAGLPFTTMNLGSSLLQSGKTFAGYSEDLPSVGYNGTSYGAYARKHNPWANWQSSPSNGIPPTANLPLTYIPADYDSLPTVSFIIPNQNNDMHNGSDPGTITTGDTWLRNHLDTLVRWTKTHNSLFILTFDEGTTSGSNRIATLFLGPMVRHGQYSQTINHYAVLRTLEEMYQLPHTGGSATAMPITNCWVSTSGVQDSPAELPGNFRLLQNTPNPFNPATTITYRIPRKDHILLTVMDVLGREVATLVDEVQQAGSNSVNFNAHGLASGVYFCRLQAGTFSSVGRMLLIR